MPRPSFALILPAAGSSSRYGGPRSKLLELLNGLPVVAHCLRAFLSRQDVAAIAIPTNPSSDLFEDAPPALQQCLRDPRVRLCDGGASRAHSVYNALQTIDPAIEWVAVHDAARPLISQQLIDQTLAAARQYGAAVPAMPVHLTIKQAAGPLPAQVQRTVPRQQLWAMQTPQIMRRDHLLAAFQSCPLPLAEVTDDVQLIELAGGPVWLVPGEEQNLKITRPIDLQIAGWYLEDAEQ